MRKRAEARAAIEQAEEIERMKKERNAMKAERTVERARSKSKDVEPIKLKPVNKWSEPKAEVKPAVGEDREQQVAEKRR